MMNVEYEPFSPEWRRDPYSKYRELRDHAPIHYAPESKVWCVSRYEDVAGILNDPETFSSKAMFIMLMNRGDEGPHRSPGRSSSSPRGRSGRPACGQRVSALRAT